MTKRRTFKQIFFLLLISSISISAQIKQDEIEKKVKDLLSKMTLDEKVGQMTQADMNALVDPADVEKYFLGHNGLFLNLNLLFLRLFFNIKLEPWKI